MKLDKEGLIAKDPAALRAFQAIVRECSRIGAGQVGAAEFVDDISQEVMILVLMRTIHEYDPEREVEPFLIECAKRMGKAMRRRHGREVLMGDSGDDSHSDTWINSVADPDHEDIGDLVDREHSELTSDAEAAIAAVSLEFNELIAKKPRKKRSAKKKAASRPLLPNESAKAATKKKSAKRPSNLWDAMVEGVPIDEDESARKRVLTDDAMRIREIRVLIRFSHEWMSGALGISVSQLHAIEYGVSFPPDGLVLIAESVLAKVQAECPSILEPNISDVVKGWFSRLGLAPDDYFGFSKEIGINRSTAFRWLRKTYKPTSDRIWHIERKVQAIEKERHLLISAMPKSA